MRKWTVWIGTAFMVGLVSVLTAQYVLVHAPQRNELRAIDTRMDQIDAHLRSKGAVSWEPRRYHGESVTQAWFAPRHVEGTFEDVEFSIFPSSDTHHILKATIRR